MKEPQRLIDMKHRREITQSLNQLAPLVQTIASTGCGVSLLAHDYIKRALQGAPYNSPVIGLSYPNWVVGPTGMEEFIISSRASDYKGDFFRVKRVLRNDHPLPAPMIDQDNFIKAVKERTARKTVPLVGYFIVMGKMIQSLFEMSPYIVEFRIDNGMHLLIQEKPGTNRYLEIYLGGWMDEVAFKESEWDTFIPKEH
jgi:hypothetical protein